MPTPTNTTKLRQFLRMLSKFATNLADQTKPLRDLVIKTSTWVWGVSQQNCFEDVKKSLLPPQYWGFAMLELKP